MGAKIDVTMDTALFQHLEGLPLNALEEADRARVKARSQKYFLNRHRLYRQMPKGSALAVPTVSERPNVVAAHHDKLGHMGMERTYQLVRKRFYWPGMY